MSGALRFLFGRVQDENGRTVPYTRWDLLAAVVLAIALMATMAYFAEPHGWTPKRAAIVSAVPVLATITTCNRRAVWGCAFAIVTSRMLVGIFIGGHELFFAAGAVMFAAAAWLLLRDLRYLER